MREITYTEKLTALEFIKLRDSAGWFPVTEEQAENCIRNCTFLISARSGNEILAMGRAWFDYGYTAYIGDVIVMPAYQRQGIGANIIFHSRSYRTIILESNTNFYLTAIFPDLIDFIKSS